MAVSESFLSPDNYVRTSELEDKDLYELLKRDPVNLTHQLVKVTRAAMSGRVAQWKRYRRKYRRGSYYLLVGGAQPLYSTNYIFNVVETLKAHMGRAFPSIIARPVERSDDMGSELMTKLLMHELRWANLTERKYRVLHHGLITGLGWFKVYFDPEAYQGRGGLCVEALPPELVLCDPLAFDDRKARWIIHMRPDVPVEELERKFNTDLKRKVGEDDRNEEKYLYDRTSGHVSRIGRVTDAYEVWVKNWKEDRWYVAHVAGNTVIQKPVPSPYAHGEHPFVPFIDGFDDGADNLYEAAIGEIEEIEPLQDQADALDMQIYANIKHIVNRQRVVNSASGLRAHAIDNAAGRTWEVQGDPSRAIHWDAPPPLPPDVYAYRSLLERRIQLVSGVFDVTQGRRPTGIEAARALEALQEASAIRIEFRASAFAEALKRVANLSLQIILQFYQDERIIRTVEGDEIRVLGDWPDSLKYFNEDGEEVPLEEIEDEDLAEALKRDRELWMQENGIDLVLSDMDFLYDLEVDTDTSLTYNRALRAQTAVDLFRLGAIDRKALLDALDWPNRTEILRRLGEVTTGKTPPEADLMMAAQNNSGVPGIEQMMALQAMMGMGGGQTQ